MPHDIISRYLGTADQPAQLQSAELAHGPRRSVTRWAAINAANTTGRGRRRARWLRTTCSACANSWIAPLLWSRIVQQSSPSFNQLGNSTMKRLVLLIVLLCLPSWALAQTTKVTPLLMKELTGIPGKEGTMLTVEYSPGESSPIHRHNAQVFVSVLEGAVIMQVKGGNEGRLTPGQTFYESPSDVHVVSRNAST